MISQRHDIIYLYGNFRKPLILDGALGSFLQQSGLVADKYLWFSKINITNPDFVKKVHQDYINAGADIITTNTFRTNPVALKSSSLDIDINEIVNKSIKIAIDARMDRNIIIAGSNAPAEDCYQIERTITKYNLEYNHKKHIEVLWENGVDVIWNETQSHLDEIEIIAKFCSDNSLPFVINFFFDENLRLLSGESLNEIIEFVLSFNPIAIGFNCIKPSTFHRFFKNNELNYKYGFYFNCGSGNITDETITCGILPPDYVNSIKHFITNNTLFIGSCCGSSPSHTKAIKEFVNELY